MRTEESFQNIYSPWRHFRTHPPVRPRRISLSNNGGPAVLMRTSNQSAYSTNQFLRLLSQGDRALLMERLRRTTIEPGTLLLTANEPITTIYFPESIIVSIQKHAGDAQHIETAVVGYEGLVGWSGLLSAGRSPQRAVVQMKAGTVLGISVNDITSACETSRTLLSALMCFVETVMIQMAQAIASHLRDPLDRRVCRWLLMRHDRILTDQLFIRHDEISGNLGSRRASVTDCLHVLEGERLIRCHRGRIIVRDRDGLELLAGDSYGSTESHYRELIGPFGERRRSGSPDLQPTSRASTSPCASAGAPARSFGP